MILNEIETQPNITFEFKPEAEHLKAGLVCDHLYAYENGKKVGYLKIDRIDPDRFRKECPDVWSYNQEFGGKHLFSDTTVPVAEKPLSELIKALRSGYLHRHVSYWAKEMKWDSESIQIITKITDEYQTSPEEWSKYHDLIVKFFLDWPKKTNDGKKAVKDMKAKYSYLIKPFVAYINTKENRHQGLESDNSKRGIGTMLYITGAKWIKDRGLGLGLYASTLQSEDAQRAWKKFERNGMVGTDGERKYIKV